MTKDETLYLLARNSLNLYTACLNGSNGRNRLNEIYQEMKDVKKGDLVIEGTSAFIWMRGDNKTRDYVRLKQSIGILLDIGHDDKLGKTYLIKNLLGVKFNWHNASFIKIREDWDFYKDPKSKEN